MGLSKRILLFITYATLLLVIVSATLIYSWISVKQSIAQEIYALGIERQIDLMQSDFFKGMSSNFESTTWSAHHAVLMDILNSAPPLSPHQKVMQLSMLRQSLGLQSLFLKLKQVLADDPNSVISQHLKERLFVQIEQVSEDSQKLLMASNNELRRTIEQQIIAVLIILISGVLFLGLYINRFRKRLLFLSQALRQGVSAIRRSKYSRVEIEHEVEEFSEFVEQFNRMTEQLKTTVVTRDVLQKIVDERTAELREISETDALTQLPNRRALFERGQKEISQAKRHDYSVVILIIDCDYFKKINDDFGHLVGDKVLFHIARIFEKEVRKVDIVGRYGGEEFVFVLPYCDLESGKAKAEAIQKLLADNPLYKSNQKIDITVSIGIAALTNDNNSFESLVNDADGALYIAKKNGRNRIEVADSGIG